MIAAVSLVANTMFSLGDAGTAPVSQAPGGTIPIAPGVSMPVVANGCSPFAANNSTTAALDAWFRAGGRAVDTAFEYSNQPWVGEAVRAAVAGGLPRDDIFVITKIKCVGTTGGALALVQEGLRRLGLEYADLVIIHGPGFVDPQSGGSRQCDDWRFNRCCKTLADLQATYRGLEMAVARNLTRAIGVSNFQTKQLEAIVANAMVMPAVNQMQMYVGCRTPWCITNNATIASGKKHGITFQAYSPLGHGKAIDNPAVQRVARSHNVSAAQVALAWIVQQGHAFVTSSDSQLYDREDIAVDAIQLSDAEMRQLNAQGGDDDNDFSSSSGPPVGAPCNADLDCVPTTGSNWRCRQYTAAPTPTNNCHIPGPGTAGNNTCACTVQKCLPTPPDRGNGTAVGYLVIGDSISLGMKADLAALVSEDGWALTHNPGNAASSNLGAHCIADWVQGSSGTRRWDVISFQFGLHDLGFDTERIAVQQYTALLTNITTYLVGVQKRHGTKLLWVKTTPVPTVPTYGPGCNDTHTCLDPPRFDADVVLYNAAADGVMAAANAAGARIATADLYSFVLAKCGGKGYAHCDGFQLPMNVHYTATGWAALAGQMHTALRAL